MGDPHCTKVFKKNKEKDEGANESERLWLIKRKDKENGSDNPGMGKLLCKSEGQKQDEGIRRTGKNKVTNGDMETMEEAEDKKGEPTKVGDKQSEGL